jgi:hypothetical protein
MSMISQWCRYCGVENRPDATACYRCGRPLVVLNQRQQVPQSEQQNVAPQQSGRRNIGRSSRLFVPLSIICLVLIVGVGATLLYFHINSSSSNNNPPSNVTIIWRSVPNAFTQQDQQSIQIALQSALSASNSSSVAGHTFTIIDAQRQGDWVNLSAKEQASQSTQPIATEPLFFLAHLQGTTWNVWMPGSSGFCSELKQTPDTLLDPIDKHYFRGCYQ